MNTDTAVGEESGIGSDGRYRLYRDQVEAEANWIATRTNWLLTANAFMLTAIAVVATAPSQNLDSAARLIRHRLPGLAIVINLGTFLMIVAAELVTIQRVRDYTLKHAWLRKSDRTVKKFPDILGGTLPHLIGVGVPAVFAVLLAYGWYAIGAA